MIGIPQDENSSLSSDHGMYLNVEMSDGHWQDSLYRAYWKTMSLGKVSPGLRVVILADLMSNELGREERR